jgi:Zn-dependent protease
MAEALLTFGSESRFDDPALEEQYDQERRALLEPAQGANRGVLLVVTLAAFILTQLRSAGSAQNIAMIVAVLLFHELGHYAGMRIFGYRDVRMFFIPFFGAAVTGRREGVAAWKEAVVLLLGPLPGILLGIALLLWNIRAPDPLKKNAVFMLLLVNGFNLLPLGGLDGAQLFQRVLFSRHRFLEIGFLGAASGALALLAVHWQSWPLGAFAYLGILLLPRRYAVLGIVRDLRRDGTALPCSPAQLDERAGRTLFLAARKALPDRFRTRAKAVAAIMREVLDAARPAPGFIATCLLLVGWLLGVTVVLAATVLIAMQSQPEKWHKYEISAGGFSAEYPSAPAQFVRHEKTPFGEVDASYVTATQDMLHRFTVQYYDAPSPLMSDDVARWMDERLDQLSRQVDARIVATSTESDGTRVARLENGSRVWRVRLVARGNRFYTVTTSSPPPPPEKDRFFASFALLH